MKTLFILSGLLAHIAAFAIESTDYEKMVGYVACKAIEIDLLEKGLIMDCQFIPASPTSQTSLQKCIRDARASATQPRQTGSMQEYLEREKAHKETALQYAQAIHAQAGTLKVSADELSIAELVEALLENNAALRDFVKQRKKNKTYEAFMQGTIQSLQLAYHESYPHIEVVESLKAIETRLAEQRTLNFIIYGTFLLFLVLLSVLFIRSNQTRSRDVTRVKQLLDKEAESKSRSFQRAAPNSDIIKSLHRLESTLDQFRELLSNASRHDNRLREPVERSVASKEMTKEQLFFSQPDENGVFNSLPTKEFIGGKSLYIFSLMSNKDARFHLYDHPQVKTRALKMVGRAITPACTSENAISPNHSGIKTLEDGLAEKLPDGKWKVKTKARIRYV